MILHEMLFHINFYQTSSRLTFSWTRLINSHIDYECNILVIFFKENSQSNHIFNINKSFG